MKKFLALLLAAVMMLSLVACGGTASSSSSSVASESKEDSSAADESSETPTDEVVKPELPDEEITLWVHLNSSTASPEREPTEENPNPMVVGWTTMDAWLADKPNVTFEWHRNVTLGNLSDATENMTIQVNAGTAPDVFFAWGNKFDTQGWLADLTDSLERPNHYEPGNTKWLDMFPEYLWEADQMTMNVKGQKLSIPFSCYPGASTCYYYNVDMFEEHGKEVPSTYQELVDLALYFRDLGITGMTQYEGLGGKIDASDWLFWQSLCPAYAVGFEAADLDGDQVLTAEESLKWDFAGHQYATTNDNVKEVYRAFKYNKTQVMDEGFEGIDYLQRWLDGEAAMVVDGLWRLSSENSRTNRDFDFDMFLAPLVSSDTYADARVAEYTEAGPYQPDIEVALNVMKPEVQNRPEANFAYAVDYLMWITNSENLSMFIEERGGSMIGPTKGCAVPGALAGFLSRPFPKPLVGSVAVTMRHAENTELNNKLLEQYVYDMITEEEFFAQRDELFWKDMNMYAEQQGIDTSDWEKVEPSI